MAPKRRSTAFFSTLLVIEQRVADRLNAIGIERGRAAALAEAIDAETDTERLARARAEMDDEERAQTRR